MRRPLKLVWFMSALGFQLAVTGPALGYVQSRTSVQVPKVWSRSCIELLVDTKSLPPNLTSSAFVAAVQKAADAWSAAAVTCTGLRFHVTASADTPEADSMDGVNRIVFRTRKCGELASGSCSLPDSALAGTTVYAVKATGEILEADIEINAALFVWSDTGIVSSDGQPMASLNTVLMQEIGHLVGLDNVCRNSRDPAKSDDKGIPVPECSAATRMSEDTIMVPTSFGSAYALGDTVQPGRDELEAICTIYPRSTLVACPALDAADGQAARDAGPTSSPQPDASASASSSGSGCTVTGSHSTPDSLGVLLAALWGFLRRRRIPPAARQ